MAILKVARLGHPVLRKQAEPIPRNEIKGPEIQTLIANMFESMHEHNGVGLAAPQVHVSKQLALVGGLYDDEDKPETLVVINPEITPISDELFGMYEGCLSIPGMRGYVERPVEVHVKALDENGEEFEMDLDGYPAVVMQHECDHLIGKLYIDRMKDLRKLAYDDEAERFLPIDTLIDGRDI